MLVTTIETPQEKQIKKTLGLVLAVRELNSTQPRRAITEAVVAIISQAKARKADGILGLRINMVTSGNIVSVVAYGTAVQFETP